MLQIFPAYLSAEPVQSGLRGLPDEVRTRGDRSYNRPVLQRVTAIAAALVLLAFAPSALLAQRGGGMGGGGMGGMGGGMGRGGGGRGGSGRGGRSGADRPSASAAVKENLKANDQIAFILDHKKPLKITGQQSDTLKAYRKEMLFMQEPVFKDMDKIVAEGITADRGPGTGPTGGTVGGKEAGIRSSAGGASDTVRTLIAKLNDIQDAYRDRARAKLNATQLHLTDSLQIAVATEARDKQAKAARGRGE